MLRFVRHFLRYFSVTSVYSSSSSLVQDGVHSQLQYRSLLITWRSIPITVSPFSIFFHHFIIFHHFMISTLISWYIGMHPTLAGFYPFLLGSPARCAFLSYFMCLGSPARPQLSCSHSCPNTWGISIHKTTCIMTKGPLLLRCWMSSSWGNTFF